MDNYDYQALVNEVVRRGITWERKDVVCSKPSAV